MSGILKSLPSLDGLDLSEAGKNLTASQFLRLQALVVEFQDIFALNDDAPPCSTGAELKVDIPPDVEPYAAPVRRYSPSERIIIIDHVSKLLEEGVVEPSDSPWNANVLLVPKKDGTKRLCVDFRRVNALTRPIAANLPRLRDNLDVLGEAKIFSACDIASAYFSINLYEPHRDYTSFHCPGLGAMRFCRCPMGLKNSQSALVNLTLTMLRNYLYEFVAVYSDDILVYSADVDAHICVHLRSVFERFRKHNVRLKAAKVALCTKSVLWCGFQISSDGISADPRKIAAIKDMRLPSTLKELRSFLGSCNWLRHLIPRFADISSPLRPLLKKGCFRTNFSKEQLQAFSDLKTQLTSAPLLGHPLWDRPFEVHCDASNTAIAGALMQRGDEGKLRVVSYLSKALTEAQKAYGVHERELLALLYCLETWRSYFFGTTVTCWTDSTAVAWLVKPSSNHSGRLLRWLIRLGEFNTDVHHKSGVTNHLPDFMSRCGASSGSQTPSRDPPPLAVITRAQSRAASAAPPRRVAEDDVKAMDLSAGLLALADVSDDDSKAQPRQVDDGDVKSMDVSADPLVDDGSSDDDPDRALGLSHSSVSDVRRDPMESILPDCDVKDDIQTTRPDIVLYSDVDDVLGLFREHQTTDKKLQRIRTYTTTGVCADDCRFHDHASVCHRFHWIILSGVLYRCSLGKPVPVDAESTTTMLQLKRTPCACTSDVASCLHRRWALTPMPGDEPDEKTVSDGQLQEISGFELRPRRYKVVVPTSLVDSVQYHCHGLGVAGHPGVTRTVERVRKTYWWKGMHRTIRRWVLSCLRCRRRKACRPHNVVFPKHFPCPSRPMEVIMIDFSGPYPTTARGNTWILGIICVFSRWPICVPLPSRKASLVVRALLEHVLQHYACPRLCISDNAQEFIGNTMADFCKVFDIRQLQTPAYSPWMLPHMERYHSWQSACMTVLLSRYKDTWDLVLPLVTMSYRTTVGRTTGFSPYHIMFGHEPRMPFNSSFDRLAGDNVVSSEDTYVHDLETTLGRIYKMVRSAHDASALRDVANRSKKYRPSKLRVGDFVLTWAPKSAEVLPNSVVNKPKFMDRWTLPREIVSIPSPDHFVVRDDKGVLHDVRADSAVRYQFYTDGLPSIPSRPGFSKRERARINKAMREGVNLPMEPEPGLMAVFPLELRDGAPGFGVGKFLQQTGQGCWDLHWYSNSMESLDGPFLPCWVKGDGTYYCGPKSSDEHVPFRTSEYYPGDISREVCADIGFALTDQDRLPHSVLVKMDAHPSYGWTLESASQSLQ